VPTLTKTVTPMENTSLTSSTFLVSRRRLRIVRCHRGAGIEATRSHRRYRSQARRPEPAGFSFGFGGCAPLLILAFKFLLIRRDRPRKSGSPPPFAPSLKVQGEDTHNNSGFFGDLTPSITKQLSGAVRMARGTTVFRIRMRLIFRRCWNLITPWRSAQRHRESAAALVRYQ
jgi:hypothetical protein